MSKQNVVYYILIAVLIFAAFIRIYGIEKESYWLDEAVSIRQAQVSYPQTITMLKDDKNLPLYVSLLWSWVHLFGTSEASARLLSALFGVASVLLIFLVGKRMFNIMIGLYAAIFLALSTIGVYYSQEARLYSFFMFLCLLSFYAYILFEDKKSVKHGLFYFISSLLMIYTNLFAAIVLVIQNMHYIIYNYKQVKKLFYWFLMQLSLAILFLPWLPMLAQQLQNSATLSWMTKPDMLQLFRTFHEFSGDIFLLGLFLLLVILAFFRFMTYKHKEKNASKYLALIFLWFLFPPLSMYVFSQYFIPLFHIRYFLFIFPALYLLLAWSILILLKNKLSQVIVILGISLVSIFLVISQATATDKDDWRGLSEFLKNNVNNNDIIFIHPFYHQDPFAYYYAKGCFKEVDVFSCNFNKYRTLSLNWQANCCNDTTLVTSTDQFNHLQDYLNYSIWLISVRSELYDKNNSLFSYLNARKKLAGNYTFGGGIIVYKFD